MDRHLNLIKTDFEQTENIDTMFDDFNGLTEFEIQMLIFNDNNLDESATNRYSKTSSFNGSFAEMEDIVLFENDENESNLKKTSIQFDKAGKWDQFHGSRSADCRSLLILSPLENKLNRCVFQTLQ